MLGQAAQATISYLKLPQGNSCFPDAPTSESSLTSSTMSSRQHSKEHPSIDLSHLNTPAPSAWNPQCVMQLENIPEFSRTQEDTTQPSEFLKMIKHSFLSNATTADDQKVGLFELYLKSNSPAEEWFNDVKKTWLKLEKEFKTRFPNIKKAMKMAPELERELGMMRMSVEELGRTEKYRGEDVYTHMIFAEKILDLAK